MRECGRVTCAQMSTTVVPPRVKRQDTCHGRTQHGPCLLCDAEQLEGVQNTWCSKLCGWQLLSSCPCVVPPPSTRVHATVLDLAMPPGASGCHAWVVSWGRRGEIAWVKC